MAACTAMGVLLALSPWLAASASGAGGSGELGDAACLLQRRSAEASAEAAPVLPVEEQAAAGARSPTPSSRTFPVHPAAGSAGVPLTRVMDLTGLSTPTIAYSEASIPGMLLPDNTVPFANFWDREGLTFLFYSRDQFGRSFGAIFPSATKLGQLQVRGEVYKVSVFNEDLTASVLASGAVVAPQGWRPYLQGIDPQLFLSQGVFGADQPWQSDGFLGSVISAGHLGLYLRSGTPAEFVQDLSLSGWSYAETQGMRLVRNIFRQAPASILRTKVHLDAETRAATKIKIYDAAGRRFGPYTPSDGTKWFLAKRAVAAANIFLGNALHLAIHVYLGLATAALQNSLPVNSVLYKALAPNTFTCVNTLVAAATLVFGKDNSVFGTGLYNVGDLDAFNAANGDFARFILTAPLSEVVGCEAQKSGSLRCPAPWWAAGAVEFLPAIEAWADAVAQASLADRLSRMGLAKLPGELLRTGLETAMMSNLRLNTRRGLADFLAKFIWSASVFHGQHVVLREFVFTPLGAGGSFSAPILDVLKSPSPPATEAEALDVAYPKGVSAAEISGLSIEYFVSSTAVQAAPLGEGPYDLDEGPGYLSVVLHQFRSALNATRARVKEILPKNGGGYVPLQLYPLEDIKTVGLTVPQGPEF